jgi:endonuclease/exonuclease/phosphatase family metal-dependent hydrolase
MRIASWNIGGGFISTDGTDEYNSSDIDYIATNLKEINPDIVCLQEVHKSEDLDQASFLAKELGLDFFHSESTADSHLQDGQKLCIGILSRYQITSIAFHSLRNPLLTMMWRGKEGTSHDKGLVEAQIKTPHGLITVFSAHMLPFHRFERSFLEDDFTDIREEIQTILLSTNLPTLLGADMNFEDINTLLPGISKKYQSLLPNEPTTPRHNRIDKILASSDFTVQNSGIITGQADHYLCWSELNLQS